MSDCQFRSVTSVLGSCLFRGVTGCGKQATVAQSHGSAVSSSQVVATFLPLVQGSVPMTNRPSRPFPTPPVPVNLLRSTDIYPLSNPYHNSWPKGAFLCPHPQLSPSPPRPLRSHIHNRSCITHRRRSPSTDLPTQRQAGQPAPNDPRQPYNRTRPRACKRARRFSYNPSSPARLPSLQLRQLRQPRRGRSSYNF